MYGWRLTGRMLSSPVAMAFWSGVAILTVIIGFATGDAKVIFGLMAAAVLGAVRSNKR